MIGLVTKLCYQEAAIRGNSVKYAFKYACSKYALNLSAYRSNGGQVTFKNFKYQWFIWVTEVDFQTGFDRLFEQSMWRTSMPSQYWTSLSFKEHLLPFQVTKKSFRWNRSTQTYQIIGLALLRVSTVFERKFELNT